MITLALDTATDRCTVALEMGGRVGHRYVDGSRTHAGAILGLVDELLGEFDAGALDIGRVLIADGPGSFTGLRVAASVAKALAWRRNVTLLTAPSLLVRAAAHAPVAGGTVLSVSDALRGELYAAMWRVGPIDLHRISQAPRAVTLEALAGWQSADVVVASGPEELVERVARATGREPISGVAALPDARMLFKLAGLTGGVIEVSNVEAWEPEYGRPAEAQAAWERAHGTELPVAPGIAR